VIYWQISSYSRFRVSLHIPFGSSGMAFQQTSFYIWCPFLYVCVFSLRKNWSLVLGISYSPLLNLSPHTVNDLFWSYITKELFDWCLAFMDGPISTVSADYAVYIFNFHISYSDILYSFFFSFSAEGHAIIQALLIIQILPTNKYLIILDS